MSADLFSPLALGPDHAAEPHGHGPDDPQPGRGGDAPTDLAATYYAQRASAGLIISEAAQVSAQAKGYPATPGIFSDAQVAGWRTVTDAVHARGGHIFLQLWHVGRVALQAVLPGTRCRWGRRRSSPPARPSAARTM